MQVLMTILSNPFLIAAMLTPVITGTFMIRAVITAEVSLHYIFKRTYPRRVDDDYEFLPPPHVMTWHPKHWLKWNTGHWAKWIDKQKEKK